MAIRYREKYQTWQVYWTNPLTKKRQSKTCRSREEAEKENSLLLHRLKYDPESFREEAREKEEETTEKTFEQVYLEYLCDRKFTKRALCVHRGLMQYALETLGAKAVSEITRDDLEGIKQHFLNRPIAPATVRAHLSVLRTVIYYAREKGLTNVPFPRIPSPRYKTFVPPSPEELRAMLEVAPPHIQRVILLGAYCGVRIGHCELYQLTWDDVDLGQRILRVHGSKKNDDAAYREVPIREEMVSVFREWQREDLEAGAQYLVNYKGKRIKATLKRAWRRTLSDAGITRRIRPYDLRHAFGTELVAAGVDVGTVAKLMGHSNPAMLLNHYQYVMDKQKRAAVEALPSLPITDTNVPHNVPQ